MSHRENQSEFQCKEKRTKSTFKNPLFQERPSQKEVNEIFPSICNETNECSRLIAATVDGFVGVEGHKSSLIKVYSSASHEQNHILHCLTPPRQTKLHYSTLLLIYYVYFVFLTSDPLL